MRRTSTLIALAAAVFSPHPAVGETYWVSPDGTATWDSCEGSTPIDGSSACPLNVANSDAVAGDTVNLREGTYTDEVLEPERSGSSESARIVFTAYDGEEVLLRDGAYGIYIYQQSYITVNGISFVSPRRFFRIYAGHYNVISHCTFDQRSPESGDWAGAIIADDPDDDTSASEDSTHNWVHHCSFYRWVYGAWDEHRGALLNLGTDQSEGDDSSFNLIEDNVFAYGGHHTIGVYAQYNVIRHNYIHNETDPEEWDFEGYRGAITEGPSAGRCLYEGNQFGFSTASGIGLRSPFNIFRFNEFFHNGSGGIQIVTNSVENDRADQNRIYHNAFFHNGHEADYSGFQGGLYFSSWSGVSPIGNVVKNNIFYDNRNGSVTYDGDVDPQDIDSNWDDNDVDPGFVDLSGDDPQDPVHPDLHLVEDSSARDQGTWLTTITSPAGAGDSFAVVDAGYFMDGWTIIEGDLIQLEGQQERARITVVDYETNTITVDGTLDFTTGQGVSLAYADAAPDLGAFEIWDGDEPDSDADGDIDGDGDGDSDGDADGDGDGDGDGDVDADVEPADGGGPDGRGSEGCSCRLVHLRRVGMLPDVMVLLP